MSLCTNKVWLPGMGSNHELDKILKSVTCCSILKKIARFVCELLTQDYWIVTESAGRLRRPATDTVFSSRAGMRLMKSKDSIVRM
jgi:hypothetical protein